MVLKGRYLIEQRIGSGGMAEVYRGMDLNTERTVAVKVLRAEFAKDEEFVRRFQREAQAAAALSHQHLVGVHDLGDEDGIQFIIMEYVRGVTLKDVVREKGALPIELTIRFAHQLCEALSHAHQEHIIHRDIKPQNIIIDQEGCAKLTDFGIARATTSQTVTLIDGSVMGSVHYFSPEQARGELAEEQSDLYSLGVVLYEMAAGKVPFDGETPVSIALQHLQEPPADPRKFNSRLPQSLCEVISKAMAKDKADRYQSAEEMDQDIRLVLKRPEGGFVAKRQIREEDPTRLVPVVNVESSGEPNEVKELRLKEPPLNEPRANEVRPQETPVKADDPIRTLRNGRLSPFDEPEPHRENHFLTFLAVLLIVAAFAGVTWLVITMIGRFSSDAYTYVPDAVGKSREAAEEAMVGQGLEPHFIDVYDNIYAVGLVTYQEPVGRTQVSSGSIVEVYISKGPMEVTVPGLYTLDVETAEDRLKRIGLVPEVVRMESELPRGQVFRQEPEEGETAHNGDSVTLYVSEPPIMRIAPNVLDMMLEEAANEIRRSGLLVGEIYSQPASDLPPGVVFRQTPEFGQEVLDGSVVDLWITASPTPPYRKQITKAFVLPESGADVRVEQVDQNGIRSTVYEKYHEGGEVFLELNLASDKIGEVTLHFYHDGTQAERERITFTEKDLVQE